MLEFSSEPGYAGGSNAQRLSIWVAVFAGLLAAFTAAVLVCRSPQTSTPQFVLVLLASAYLALTALSGATGSYVWWVRSRKWPASELVELLQSTVSGWVWIPAIVLLSRKDSIWAPAVAAAGAIVLAVSLRKSGPTAFNPAVALEREEQEAQELFAQTLRAQPAEWYGPVVAVCLFSVGLALEQGWLFPACALLALAGFAFAWARTSVAPSGQKSIRKLTAATIRQTNSAVPALIVTILAMAIGMGHDIGAWGLGGGIAGRRMASDAEAAQKNQIKTGLGGHVSIVLLTAPQEQRYIVPRAREPFLQGSRLIKPLEIQFDGEYWYFQPPDSDPGPAAFKARVSPLTANIHSNLAIPLMMQAHQHLGTPLPIGCCREVDVKIENRDERGAINVGMMLTDTTAHGKPSLILGERKIEPGQPSATTLRFAIPVRSSPVSQRIQKFDQIDFVIVPEYAHAQSGAKIAIRTLEFLP